MKTSAFILALLCATAQAHILPKKVGLHIASWHSEPGYNNSNPGFNAQWDNDFTTGFYKNSESKPGAHKTSVYVGRIWQTERSHFAGVGWSSSLTVGLVTGYARAKVLPFAMPAISTYFGKAEISLGYIPKIDKSGAHTLHVMISRGF